MTDDLLRHALRYADRGWPVIPLHTPVDGRCDCRRDCGSPGKHPRTKNGLSDASTDADQVRAWWRSWPTANVGLVIPDDLVVLDFDRQDVNAVVGKDRPLPTTALAETGKGWHFLYRTDRPVRPAVAVLDGLDIRGPGSYIVAPPSVHVSGHVYTWTIAPKVEDIAEAPSWVYTMNRPAPATALEPGERIPSGKRNAELASLAGTMRRRGMDADEIEAALLVTNGKRCDPPLPDDEVRTIARSVARYDPSEHSDRPPVPPDGMNTPPRFRTAQEVTASTPERPDWIVRPWIAAGAITELDGKPKAAGKTTMLMFAVRAVLDGLPFLGEPTVRMPVVYLTEQGDSSLREVLARADLLDRTDLHLLTWSDARGRAWPDVVASAVAHAQAIGSRLLIVDTLPQFAGLRGDGENDAGQALEALLPLQAATAAGLAVVIARHDRKSGGEVGESARGSSAFTGAVDVVLALRRKGDTTNPNVRDLAALSRFDETPDLVVIEYQPDGYRLLGSDEAYAFAEARAAVRYVLGDEWMTREQVLDSEPFKNRRTTGGKALAAMVGTGEIESEGRGVKGDPTRYRNPVQNPVIHSVSPKGLTDGKELLTLGVSA